MLSSIRRACHVGRQLSLIRNYSHLSICLEGNIASGKTTCLEFFKGFDFVEVQDEPVKQWRDIEGYNALATMYKDPRRWTYTFQTFVLLTLLHRQMQPMNQPFRVSERSLYSARYCFIENQHKRKDLTEYEYVLLAHMYDVYTQIPKQPIDMLVYLRTRPEVVHRRIQLRERKEEHGIPLSYLQELHDLHEEWLIKGKNLPPSTKVVVIDANKSIAEMQEEYRNMFGPILKWIRPSHTPFMGTDKIN